MKQTITQVLIHLKKNVAIPLKHLKEAKGQIFVPGFQVNRGKLVGAITVASFGILILRSAVIQLSPPSSEALKQIASRQYETHLTLAPYRGPILDRNGQALALSLKKPSVAVNPKVFKPTKSQLKNLSQILHIPMTKIAEISDKSAYFSWVKRKIEPDVAAKVEAMQLKGLYLVHEATRFYPLSSIASQLIGAVGSENQGLMGIERQFDDVLAGKSSAVRPAKDARGQTILYSSDLATPDLPGHTIQLTIDHVIQEFAEEALENGVKAAQAKSGFAIVTDPHTGKILALANYPTFDLNRLTSAKPEQMRNFAFLDLFEPGSIIKPFVIAAALEQGKTQVSETHNCENGAYRVGGVVFRDDHPVPYLSTEDTLVRSNNVCTFKIAERIGKQGLHDALKSFGFSKGLTLAESFPPTMRGHISDPSQWKPIRFANVAFGQGMTTTGLEMAMAYGVLANGGHLMKPILVDRITAPSGDIVFASSPEASRQSLSLETARQVRQILAKVVTDPHGTASRAATTSYTTGGKTGTAEKVDPVIKAYSPDKRISSFAGFAPVLDPYLVIYVMIDEPKVRPAYGGLLAAPVFSEIAQKSLRYLNVAPDKIIKLSTVAAGRPSPSDLTTATREKAHDPQTKQY